MTERAYAWVKRESKRDWKEIFLALDTIYDPILEEGKKKTWGWSQAIAMNVLGRALIDLCLPKMATSLYATIDACEALGRAVSIMGEKLRTRCLFYKHESWFGEMRTDTLGPEDFTHVSHFKASDYLLKRLPEFITQNELDRLYIAFLHGAAEPPI